MRKLPLAVWSAVCCAVVLGSLPAHAGPFGWFRRSAVVVDSTKGASVVTVRRGWIVESKPVEAKAEAKKGAKAAECSECQKSAGKK